MTAMTQPKTARTVGIAIGVLALGLVLGWLARGILAAPHDALTVATYGDWRLACPPRAETEKACMLSQNVVDQRTQAVVMQVALSHQKAKPVIEIVVPLNKLLPPGIGVHIGDAAVKTVAYKSCNSGACVADIIGDKTLFDSILSATRLGIDVTEVSGQLTTMALSINGLKEAAAAMRDADSKRHSWLRRAFL